MAIYFTNTASINFLQVTGSTTISSSTGILLQLIGSGSTLFSISGSTGEIMKITDISSNSNLFTVSTQSIDIFAVDSNRNVKITGSLIASGSLHSMTGSLFVSGAISSSNEYFLFLSQSITTGADTNQNVLTGMSFGYLPNSTYIIDLYMMGTAAAATTGFGFNVSCSTAVSQSTIHFNHQLANTGTQSGGSAIANNASTGVSSGFPNANVIVPIMGRGMLITAGTSGICTFMFRSETTAASTCVSGSIITVKKIR